MILYSYSKKSKFDIYSIKSPIPQKISYTNGVSTDNNASIPVIIADDLPSFFQSSFADTFPKRIKTGKI
ncbi:MAG: hypothetical protein QF812_01700 [Nitrososphaerales archaeon]|nr:hypothetical protein [Nitrososphaerales archaeon]